LGVWAESVAAHSMKDTHTKEVTRVIDPDLLKTGLRVINLFLVPRPINRVSRKEVQALRKLPQPLLY
jgi:hypothetical protein